MEGRQRADRQMNGDGVERPERSSSPPLLVTVVDRCGQKRKCVDESYKFVDEIPEALICPICFQPFAEPVIVNGCGHEFCNTCLKDSIRRRHECPICRQKVRTSKAYCTKLRRVEQEIGGLRVFCPNASKGCNQIVKRSDIEKHTDECAFQKLQCVHAKKGCEYESMRATFGSHIEDCPYEKLKNFIERTMQQQQKLVEENKTLKIEQAKLRDELSTFADMGATFSKRKRRMVRARMYAEEYSPDEQIEVESMLRTERTTIRLKLKTRMERVREVLEKQNDIQILLYLDGLPQHGGYLIQDSDTGLTLGLADHTRIYCCEVAENELSAAEVL